MTILMGIGCVLAIVGILILYFVGTSDRDDRTPSRAVRRIYQLRLRARPRLSDEEWQVALSPDRDVPVAFIQWFRATASAVFEFDVSCARPDDRLCKDVGLYDATSSDVDFDFDDEVESYYAVRIPNDLEVREQVFTMGQYARYYWTHIHAQHPDADGTPIKPRRGWRRWRTGGRDPHEPGRNAH